MPLIWQVRCFEEHERAAALLHCTGSGIFNRLLQRVAIDNGMQLSEKGLCRAVKLGGDNVQKAGSYVALQSEADIFDALGLEYREPWQREGKADVIAKGTGGERWFQKQRANGKRARDEAGGSGALPLPGPPGAPALRGPRGGDSRHALY